MPRNVSTNIQIDTVHSSAICEEIGYRLSRILKGDSSELPPYFRELLDRFRQQDLESAPSLVPSLHDMEWQEEVELLR
jgi:hypothetical protein